MACGVQRLNKVVGRGPGGMPLGWVCLWSLCLMGSRGVASDGVTEVVRRSLEIPLAMEPMLSPSTTPEWLRGYLGDVEIAAGGERRGDAATAAVNQLRQAWAAGKRDVAGEILASLGSRWDDRADFVLLEAEIRRATNDSAALRRCLEKPAWAKMRAARCAYRLWLAREQPDARDALESEIVRETETETDARLFVGALLESWGFRAVAAEIWVQVAASDHPAHDYARAHVTAMAIRSGYTQLLLGLCEALARKAPEDADARFTRVYLSLLLRHESQAVVNEAKALRGARPDSPATAALLAYALLRAGDRDAALQTLAPADLSALQNRPESLIGALVLEYADPARARALATASADFLKLPEEKILYRSVLERLPKAPVN